MILPTKHISEDQALLGIGALLLTYLQRPQSVTSLWNDVRKHPSIGTFQRFILALDFLYIMGTIDFKGGLLHRSRP